jgi:hypothetical protein
MQRFIEASVAPLATGEGSPSFPGTVSDLVTGSRDLTVSGVLTPSDLFALSPSFIPHPTVKKSTKQPAPEEDDGPFPPMDEDTLTNELEEYIGEYGPSDVECWSDADRAADPRGTPDGDNEPLFVSQYGISDQGASINDLE